MFKQKTGSGGLGRGSAKKDVWGPERGSGTRADFSIFFKSRPDPIIRGLPDISNVIYCIIEKYLVFFLYDVKMYEEEIIP